MRDLDKMVDNYLRKPTDYAMQISGNWGSGKTYFYKNQLEQLIFKKKTHYNENKTYIPVYISLFGLQTTDDIATKIVFEFYQSRYFNAYIKKRSKKRIIKVSGSILKIVYRGFINLKNLGNSDDYLTEIVDVGKAALDPSELVVCFDDIERRNNNLEIDDLIGYINHMVDQGVKIIIISNEDKLASQDQEIYKTLKEKVIGITLPYLPNSSEVINDIIEKRYSGFKLYYDFLKSISTNLQRFVESLNGNFRVFIYSLDVFHDIYSILKKNMVENDNEITKTLNEHMPNVAYMTLCLAAEYKNSELTIETSDDYTMADFSAAFFSNPVHTEKNQKRKSDTFREKFAIAFEKYKVFNSILSYILGIKEFKYEEFVVEFTNKFNLSKDGISPAYQLFQELNGPNFLDLSDAEYKEKTDKLLKFASEGQIKVEHYYLVMDCVQRLNNILGYDLQKVCDELINGLEKSAYNEGLNNQYNFHQFDINRRWGDLNHYQTLIYEKGKDIVQKAYQDQLDIQAKEAIDYYFRNPEEFLVLYNKDSEYASRVNDCAFFSLADHQKLLSFIVDLNVTRIGDFKFLMRNIYRNQVKQVTDSHNIESFAKLLEKYINDKLSKEGTKIRNFLLSDLLTFIRQISIKV